MSSDANSHTSGTALCCDVERLLLASLSARGYEVMPPDGLVSPSFPDTFVPSAFHAQVVGAASAGPDHGHSSRRCGCEWVFRHVDADRAGTSSTHLSSFRMLVFFMSLPPSPDDNDDRWRVEVLASFADLLRVAGVAPSSCLLTYFGGGIVLGSSLPADERTAILCRSSGFSESNLVPVRGEACYTNLRRAGEPAGPRFEVFFPVNGRMIEVGTIVFETDVVTEKRGRLQLGPGRGRVYGGAFGIERLALAAFGRADIFDLPELRDMVDIVEQSIDPRLAAVSASSCRQLIDAVRGLALLGDATGWSASGKRAERMRRLGGIIRRCFVMLGIVEADDCMRIVSAIVVGLSLSDSRAHDPGHIARYLEDRT